MSGTPTDTPDDSTLAAEYVLGLLSAPERRRVEQRRDGDPVLAAEILAWEDRFGRLGDAVPPVAPPEGTWAAIAEQLPAPRPQLAPAPVVIRSSGARFWKWLSFGSLGVALASLVLLAVVFLQMPEPAAPTILQTAEIESDNGTALYTAVIDRGAGTATLVPVNAPFASGQALELWFIPEGGEPVSMGVLAPDAPLRIALPQAIASAPSNAAAALAISIEPPGGSPTGAPTGPVVGQGPIQAV
ncbi:anti-sigma factor [Consotaella aegiceratis]|uniref:anti-sigma factor n=1 Tax=Consotaella aegiceratis TaxID=3097961 RepID=UPI002F423CB8